MKLRLWVNGINKLIKILFNTYEGLEGNKKIHTETFGATSYVSVL